MLSERIDGRNMVDRNAWARTFTNQCDVKVLKRDSTELTLTVMAGKQPRVTRKVRRTATP